jgi:predicted extracellular nuclease
VRIIAFDTTSGAVTGEYVYQLAVSATFDPEHPSPTEMKISALVVLDADTLLIQERTDWVARLYIAELAGATNILGSQWDSAVTSPSLEALTDPAGAGIAVMAKTLRVDLERLPGMPDKIEGVALIDCTRLAVANDNDFGIGTFDQNGNNIDTGVKSKILLIGLAEPITPECVSAQLFIHDVQGAGHVSPYAAASPSPSPVAGLQGIVVGTRSNGFYLQEEDIDADIDPATSEGIFVFTGSGHGRAVGDKVTVDGTVTEFRPGGSNGTNNLTITQISNPGRVVTFVSAGNPLPAATVIGAGGRVPPTTIIDDDTTGSVEVAGQTTFDPANDGIDFYESLEGMRVQINNAVAVGPTNDFGEIPVLADNGAGAGTRTARGGIVIQPGDFNPERVILDDAIIGNANMPKVSVGTTFPGAVLGVLDYDFGNFKFLVTTNPVATNTAGVVVKETTPITVGANQFTVATFNVENLHPGNPQSKFDALAGIIVNNLRSPDIIAVEEVQDNNGATNDTVVDATATYNALIAAISGAGGPTYQFAQLNPTDDQDGGEPGGNIRVGFLYRTDRGVAFVSRPGGTATAAVDVVAGANGPELTQSPGRIDPTNSAFNSSRKPLVGEFTFNGQKLFLIGNHFNSKGGDQPLFGRFQPPTRSSEVQRKQQAQIVRAFVDDILAIDPDANVIVLGDINDFQFSEVLTILEGSGATRLHTLIESLPVEEQYSYVFDGNSQTLDHILISPNLFANAAFAFDVVHVNAEFNPQTSDHDPQLARFTLVAATPPTAGSFGVNVTEDTPQAIALQGTAASGGTLTYTIVAGPSNGTLGAVSGNQVTYTPDEHYAGPDSFTYKVTEDGVDSGVATVIVTVAPVNDAPVASNGNAMAGEDTSVEITLVATDADGDALTFSIVTQPTNGSLGPVVGNKVVYTPAPNATGPDSFTFKANDGTVDSNTATVTIAVGTTNDPPVAFNGTVSTPAGTPVALALTASDPENDTLTYAIVTEPAHGTLGGFNAATGTVTYTPTAGYSGPDTFTFRVSDGTSNSNVATVSITVVAPPPPPTFTLTVTTTGGGTVAPGSGEYEADSTVTLTAGRASSVGRWMARSRGCRIRSTSRWGARTR